MKIKILKNWMVMISSLLISYLAFSQENEQLQKDIKQSKNYLSEANAQINEGNFVPGEAEYRKAIALNPKDETGKYNLGNAYYGKKKNAEAMLRYKQAAAVATEKSEKHKAFHNLGNTFMNEKKYAEAVEAYKNALRNNPNDDETRYNLALAKDMLEKNPPQGGDGNDDKNQDNKENQDKEDQQDKQDQKDKGDQGEDKDQKDKGDENKDKKEGDDKNEGQPDQPKDKKDGDKPQQQQPVPGQLSPQQVKSLLEAMNNEEKKVQDKVNAEKQKGAKVQSSKDW
ncbi:tetratricopeptide repeat protein [Aequorivita echinoideorum]|nr:tetratricopeptide repeat protein [Aequorivita echinoideorum]